MFCFILSAKNYIPTDATQDMRATVVDQRQYYPIPDICYSEVERPYLFTGTKVNPTLS